MAGKNAETLAEEIKNVIAGFVDNSPGNYCQLFGGKYFDPPLVGFARGNDTFFDVVKEQVGPDSMTPGEALENSLKGRGLNMQIEPEQVSVISWSLPISAAIRERHRGQKDEPCIEWAYTRVYGEEFNMALRVRVVSWLEARGYLAVAPFLLPEFRTIKDPARRNFTSTWSERHVAYACGLGTFSLNDALITARGIAHRLGSVVVRAVLPEALRPYSSHMEYCIADKGCKSCIKRCPAGALSPHGHDKVICQNWVNFGEKAEARRKRMGVPKTGCGLCQVGVPCEGRIPRKILTPANGK